MSKKLHLIPGTMCNEKLWSKMLPYLHDSLELVYLDIPQEKNFDELAEHFAIELGNDALNLIGFSLGGYIATYFSMLYPNRIEKLFVISNSPTSLSVEETNQRSAILEYVEANGYKGMSRMKAASMLDLTNRTNQLIDWILEMDSELGEIVFKSQYQYTSQRLDLASAISQFPFDTHLYYSEGDKLINSKWLSGLVNSNSRLSLMSTSGSGHMLPLEKPRELASYINSWAGF